MPDDQGGSVASAHTMGVRRLGSELKKARGTMSQKVAAQEWGVAVATLGAIEQGVVRSYQPQTLAPFDRVLGRSAWDLYEAADEPGTDIPAASQADVDELRQRLVDVEATMATLGAQRPLSALEALAHELAEDELTDVISFAHFVLARRVG